MGREIKRVALDFSWPINSMIWKGYHNPYSPLACRGCGGIGYSPKANRLLEEWYLDGSLLREGWVHRITQDEVQALVDVGRLMDFTHVPRNDEQRETVRKKIEAGGNSWLPESNGYVPTAEEVNKWSKNGLAHDAINRNICIKQRCKRLGYQLACQWCAGNGHVWPDEKFQALFNNWAATEPPSGPGYQLWTTTNEGSPMSPVFEHQEELANWLVANNASSLGYQTATYDEWLTFIRGPGWAPSIVMKDGVMESGVTSSKLDEILQPERQTK